MLCAGCARNDTVEPDPRRGGPADAGASEMAPPGVTTDTPQPDPGETAEVEAEDTPDPGPLFVPGPRVEHFLATDEEGGRSRVRRTVSGTDASGAWTIEIERGGSPAWTLERRLQLRAGEGGHALTGLGSIDARSGEWIVYRFEPALLVEPAGPAAGAVSQGPVLDALSGQRTGSATVSRTLEAGERVWSLRLRLGPVRVERVRRVRSDAVESASLRVSVFGITARGSAESWTPHTAPEARNGTPDV